MPFGFDGFNNARSGFNRLPSEPTKSAAPPDDRPVSGPAQSSRAVPTSFSQPFTAAAGFGGATPFEDISQLGNVNVVPSGFITPGSSGSWEAYDPMQAGASLREIRPFSVQERQSFEAQAVDLAIGKEQTLLGLKALVQGHKDSSAITRETIKARVAVSREDLQTATVLSDGVVDLLGDAPAWAKIKAQLGKAYGESGHQQKLSVAGVTGALYSSLGAA